MAVKVGINGFGRIGRNVVRAAKKLGATDIDFVAVGPWPTSSSTTRCTAGSTAAWRAVREASSSTATP